MLGLNELIMAFIIDFVPILLLIFLFTRKPLLWLEQWYESRWQNKSK